MPFITRTLKMSIKLFEKSHHAALYAKYRPTYPEEVTKTILKYHDAGGGGRKMALDVACGSGQSTFPLAEYFEKVVGTDISEAQLSQAKKDNCNIEFRISPAEDFKWLETSSVDLVTTAQAFHWFNFQKFYDEVHRVLKPKATLAVYGYGNAVLDNDEAQKLFWACYQETLKGGGYWDKRREHIDNLYAKINLPFEDTKRFDHLVIQKIMPVGGLIGYIESWSGYQLYNTQNPGNTLLQDLSQRIEELYTDAQTGKISEIIVTWPVFILLGRNS